MALFTEQARGIIEDAEEVVVVPAPVEGVHIVTMLRLSNLDTVSHTPSVFVRYDQPTLTDEIVKVLPDLALASGSWREITPPFEVLGPGESLVVQLAAVPTTTPPSWTAIWVREI